MNDGKNKSDIELRITYGEPSCLLKLLPSDEKWEFTTVRKNRYINRYCKK